MTHSTLFPLTPLQVVHLGHTTGLYLDCEINVVSCRALVDTGFTISLVKPGTLFGADRLKLQGWAATKNFITSVMGQTPECEEWWLLLAAPLNTCGWPESRTPALSVWTCRLSGMLWWIFPERDYTWVWWLQPSILEVMTGTSSLLMPRFHWVASDSYGDFWARLPTFGDTPTTSQTLPVSCISSSCPSQPLSKLLCWSILTSLLSLMTLMPAVNGFGAVLSKEGIRERRSWLTSAASH